MSEVVQTNKNADKSVKIPTRGIVGWKKLYPILRVILTKLGIQFSLEGFSAKEINGGVHFKTTPGDGDIIHPFLTTLSGTTLGIEPGTFNSMVPTIGGVPLNNVPAPTLTLTGAGLEIISLKSTATLTDAHGYVHSATLVSVVAGRTTTYPVDNLATGEYYVTVSTYMDGAKTMQAIETSLSAHWCDDGTASSKATQTTERT